MNWSPSLRCPETLTEHLRRLADQLVDLAAEIRSSVAGLTGEAIGRAVRDILLRFWKRPAIATRSWNEGVDDWSNAPWDPRPAWERRAPFESESSPVPPPAEVGAAGSRLALVLQSGVWLLKHGTLLGAVGVGATVGSLFLFRKALGSSSVELATAVVEIASLIGLLTSAPKQLGFN